MGAGYGYLITGDGSGGGGGSGYFGGGNGGAGGGDADLLYGSGNNDVIFGDGSGGGAGGGGGGVYGPGPAAAAVLPPGYYAYGGAGGGGGDILYGGAGNDILFGDGFNGSSAGYFAPPPFGGAGGFGGGGGGGGVLLYGPSSGYGGLGGGAGSPAPNIDGYGSVAATKDGVGIYSSPGGLGGYPFAAGGGGFGASGFGGSYYPPIFLDGLAGGTSVYSAYDAGGSFYTTALAQVTAGNIYNTTAGTTSGYGAGNDLLDGEAGSDHYFGMGGADTFVVSAQDNVVSEADTIWDFTRGDGDKISLENTGGTLLTSGQVTTLLGSATVGTDTTITASNGSTIVVKGVTDLTAADFNVACFLPGTCFTTDKGEVAIEDLKAGDMMLTENGYRPLKWLAHRDVRWDMSIPRRVAPVLVKQGALGTDMPQRDLYISPAHALLVEGVLVTAELLVNGDNIVQVTDYDQDFTYYNIELDEHAVVYAEGMVVETYLEVGGNRSMYDNAATFRDLYPEHKAPSAMARGRVTLQRQLPESLIARLSNKVCKAA